MAASNIEKTTKNIDRFLNQELYGGYFRAAMPPQRIPDSQKDDEWIMACTDATVNMGQLNSSYKNRETRYKKQVNYNLSVGKFDEKDMLYVTDSFGLGQKYGGNPASMRDYNILKPIMEVLKGEELKRPFGFTVMAVNGNAISVKSEYKAKLLKDSFDQFVALEMQKYGLGQPETDEQGNPLPVKRPEEIDKYIKTDYKVIEEIQANNLLEYLKKKEDLQDKFLTCLEHVMICAEEIAYVGLNNGEPIVRVVNPMNFEFERSPDLVKIEDAQRCREDRYLSVGQVIDEYGEFLTEEQIDRLEMGNFGRSFSSANMFPGYVYSSEDPRTTAYGTTYGNNYYDFNRSEFIPVFICCWKSLKKIGFVTFTDQYNEQQESIVEEGFSLSPEQKAAGYKLEWRYINEVWESTRIGDNIYVNARPIEVQMRSSYNPSYCKLPYVGLVHNTLNTEATSLVDMLKGHQYLYNIIWYRLEKEIALAQGKKFVMDIAQIPKTEGEDLEQWLYYFTNTGVAFINSLEEGRPGDPNTVAKFNQFTSIDMTLSQSIGQYINILDKLESLIERLSGVSRQRFGAISSSETVGGVERAIVQSSLITESLFFKHNRFKEQVLTQLLEVAKVAYVNNDIISYITDDFQRVSMEVNTDMLNDNDFGIFVTDSLKDNRVKEDITALAQVILQNDKGSILDLAKMYRSNSAAEIEQILEKSEEERIQREQQQQEQENQIEQQKLAFEREKLDRQENQEELNRQNVLDGIRLRILGTSDTNENDVPDILEYEKLRLQQLDVDSKTKLEYDKIKANQVNDDKRMQHEKQQKEKDIEIEKLKLKEKNKQVNKQNKK